MTDLYQTDHQDRAALRRQMRRQRRALGPSQRQAAARQLTRHFTGHPLFLHSRHIAFYLPNDGELDLELLIHRAWAMGKHCYLPVLSPLYHNRLWFAPYHPDSPMRLNQYGIREPACRWRQMRPVWSLDLALTPLVAFDRQGNRLGMGGGYYDRTLAYLQRRHYWRKPHLIGAAYGFQQVSALPAATWDVPLHGIVTERELLCARTIRVSDPK